VKTVCAAVAVAVIIFDATLSVKLIGFPIGMGLF
jgi:hypothetical protein